MPVTYRLDPGATTYPDSTTYPGLVGGDFLLKAHINMGNNDTDDLNEILLGDDRIRGFSISRGRDSELSDMDAGHATLVVDNQDRAFDPTNASSPYYPYIRPMTRFRLSVEYAGKEEDLFVGYADAFNQTWPAPGFSDSVVEIPLTDAFKVLSLAKLPATSPPRDSYADVVLSDYPRAYWPLNDAAASTLQEQPAVGGDTLQWVSGGGSISYLTSPIVGVEQATEAALQIVNIGRFVKPVAEPGDSADMAGLSAMTVECWVRTTTSAGTIYGPESLSTSVPVFQLIVGVGTVYFSVMDSAGNQYDTSYSGLSAGNWYHVVGTFNAGFVQLFVNGVLQSNIGFSGVLDSFAGPTEWGIFSEAGGASAPGFAHLALYRNGIAADRIAAHYQAGRDRGFLAGQLTGARVSQVLATADLGLKSEVYGGTRPMTGSYMTGQDPLSEIRKAVAAESVDAVCFIAKNGEVHYHDNTVRAAATLEGTFDDDGTDNPYLDVQVDYSESFLANVWNVTRPGGVTQTTTDATSIGKYFERPQALSPPVSTDGESWDIALDMLAKYKDPFTRVTSLTLSTLDVEGAKIAFTLDLGSKIRVLRTQPGGNRIDQTSFVQKIEIEAGSGKDPWTIRIAVSPL